jgi:stage III sporulation protein AB
VCVYAGYEAAALCRQKLRITEALIVLLTYIKAQIEFFSAPLSDIYNSFHNEVLDNCKFIENLRQNGFADALDSIRYKLPDEVYESLTSFAAGLGKTGKQCQIDLCNYHIGTLVNATGVIKDSLPQKTKLYTSLSVMAGLTAVIILL